MLKHSLSWKLVGLLLIACIGSIAVLAALAVRMGTTILTRQERAALETVRSSRRHYIEKYFKIIQGQMFTYCQDRMIAEAIVEMGAAFKSAPTQVPEDAGESGELATALRNYYEQEFAARLEAAGSTSRGAGTYLPQSAAGRLLQSIYIVQNPNPIGEKRRLDRAHQTFDYSLLHRLYHPLIRDYRETFGYYDIFLFDLEGNLIYSVSKETDFGTNFLDGPYQNTNLAEVFEQAYLSEVPGSVFMVDYRSYEPSYGAAASFTAAPVFQGDVKVGVVAFQLPIDEIDSIMHEASGLGQTGQVYLVGADRLMRSGSRFRADQIFQQEVSTDAATRAVAGETGTIRQNSYLDKDVLASFAPMRIEGLHWGIVAEIEMAEIEASALLLRNRIMGFGLAIAMLLGGGTWLLLNGLVLRPVARLAKGVRRVESGDYSVRVGVQTKDEIGRLASAFNHMTSAVEQDVEARRKSEAALAESEERSRLLLESAAEGIFGVDVAGHIIFVNPAACRMLGYGATELIGEKAHALFHHSRPDGSSYPVEECPMNAAFTRGKAARVDDECLWVKNGEGLDVEYGATPVLKDGLITGAVVSFTDITERKQAEDGLRKLSRAVDQSSSTVVITDTEGCIEYVNPKFTRITGYTREEAIGNNPRVLKSGKQSPELYRDLWQTITSGKEWHGELCNRRKSGELYWEMASISPIRDGKGRITHFVAVKDDLTERKQAEEALKQAKLKAEEATKAKSDFLANMSHEIRTPMNGIIGMTDLALDTELTPEQRDYLDTVKSSADALLTLINDILDFSKIEAGKLELEPIDFALRDALADMLNTLANRAHSKGLELIYDVPSDVQDALIGDVYRLRQVIVNLVGNAIKFTETGEIIVGVEQVERTDQDVTLRFSVRDTGIGIPAEKLEAIFQPFSQADVSTTRRYGGTGLGLTISVQLVELMGGRIGAESRPGRGSTFHFTARLGLGKVTPTAEAQEKCERLESLPVLIVDDNQTNRRILEEMLRNWRMIPETAPNGKSALSALERAAKAGSPFRLVLSDVNMPEMDGFGLFETARSHPPYRDVPFILLTSAARPGDVARCREIGVVAHLIKPVKQSLLMNAIVNAVAGKDAAAPAREKPQEATGASTVGLNLRILLAEDNKVNQKFAIRVIEKANHKVVVANNGREAVEAWDHGQFDLVLMDVQMPEMDGFEATSRIRELERDREGTRPTPIIAMTANAMKGDKERCLEAGMDGYISKPVKQQILFAEIERVLGDK